MSIEAPHIPDTDSSGQAQTRPRLELQQLLVPPAMLIAAAAMGVASHLHMGLTVEVALAVAVSLFCLMLMSHILLRIADEAERADDEAAEREMRKVASPIPEPRKRRIKPRTSDEPTVSAPPANPATADLPPGPPVPDEPQPLPSATASSEWTYRPVDLRQPGLSPAPERSLEAPPTNEHAALPALGEMRLSATEARAGNAPAPDREADRIDAILKRLAHQIQAGSAERRQAKAGVEPSIVLPGMTSEPGNADADQGPLEQLAAQHPDAALASAVDALRSTAAAMRGQPTPESAPVSAAELRIAAVAEAIQAERAEVFLSPILGLADDQARHFEVSVKLSCGDEPDPRAVAEGAGLLPLLDALSVRHAAGFALLLERRARPGAVFSHVGGTSLENDQFVTNLSGRHAQGIADRMVLSFAQHEMRGLGPAQIAALGDLGRLGFRFALQGVADLDMDFEALKAIGFEFVKLDATVFKAGLICGGEHVPSSDICRHLEELGLAVVATGIADAATRDHMVSCGVIFGQGDLFGAPRPVPVAGVAGRTMAA